MRILTSVLLAAFVLTLPLSVIAAPSLQSTVDIKALALTRSDLARGFEMVPDRTVSEDRPDGVAIYDITFARERTAENLASGPFEVRSGVARTAQVEDAMLQLESTKEAFLGEGWTEIGVPPLGDETLGLSQTTDGEAGQIAHFSYLFRKGPYIMMVGIRGRPEATRLDDAVALAIVVSGRVDKALGAPASAPGGPTTGQTGAGERARVVGAGGSSVNLRAEPSTTAAVVTQVSEGTTLDVVGQDRDADGFTWRNVRASGNQTGWIASTFLETIAAPPPPVPSPGPSPAPSPAAGPTGTQAGEAAVEGMVEGGSEASTEPSPSPSPSPSPAAQSGGGTFRGSGNGLDVEGTIREPNLSAGKQLVKVRVTRNGGPVGDAFVNVIARLDAGRYRAIKADKTNPDGWTEVEWEMEGPAGTYEVVVEARTSETGPVTTATGSFRWK
jgi:hypothetical protein